MDVVAFGSLLNTLLPKVWDRMKEAKELKIAMEIDIEYVHGELRMMNALLDQGYILAKSTGDQKIIELDSKIRVLCQDTHDCIQEFLSHKGGSRTKFRMKIKEFRNKVDQVYNGFQHNLPSVQEKVSHQPSYGYVGTKNLVGMSKPLEELLELVKPPAQPAPVPPPEKRLKKVISIVGFVGLGKTLLARELYNSKGCKEFLTRARVTAGAKPVVDILKDILKDIFKNIIKKVGCPAGDHDESIFRSEDCEELCEELTNRLSNQKYFIVIDDMQRTEQWNSIKYVFPNDVDSIIIVTTTMQTVANACSKCINGYVYKLSPLDDAMSRDLFSQECPLIEPGADMLKKCDGLPLAVVSVAQILQSLELPREIIIRNLGAYLLEEGSEVPRLRWVLRNKYIGLSTHDLRSCLLYFSMYKHNMGAVPGRNSLLRRWQAEGFVDAQTGSKNLQTLVDCNIIQSTRVGTNGSTRRYRLPGVMLEYISQISKCDNFAALVSECEAEKDPNNPTKHIRRLSFHEDSATDDSIISGMDLKFVLTLAVSGVGSEAILAFKNYDLLGVLDLKECTNLNKYHVDYICKLLLLKYLSLGETVEKIPREIGHLELLETLEMRITNPVLVYKEVLKLTKLKHLLGKFELQDKVHEDLHKLSSLETISGFITDNVNGFPQLMLHMGRLRKLKICCDSTASEKNLEALSKVLKEFTRTELGGKDRSLSVDFATRPSLTYKFMGGLGSLSSLKLRGDLRPFQRYLVRMGFQHLTRLSGITKLCLSHTNLSGEDVIAGLANLGTLQYLKLEEQKLGPLDINSETFKGLIRLCLVGVQSLHGITIQQQPETLPSLASLHLVCENLHPGLESLIGSGFPRFIKEIALHSGVTPQIQIDWQTAAMRHPNWPNVLLIKSAAPIRRA